MASLAMFSVAGSLKEREAMKIDMVNPIPAISPTPIIIFQVVFCGSLAHPECTPTKEKSSIPMGFPRKSPSTIPILIPEKADAVLSMLSGMAVFASANRGKMM